jgi:hypothetical protein
MVKLPGSWPKCGQYQVGAVGAGAAGWCILKPSSCTECLMLMWAKCCSLAALWDCVHVCTHMAIWQDHHRHITSHHITCAADTSAAAAAAAAAAVRPQVAGILTARPHVDATYGSDGQVQQAVGGAAGHIGAAGGVEAVSGVVVVVGGGLWGCCCACGVAGLQPPCCTAWHAAAADRLVRTSPGMLLMSEPAAVLAGLAHICGWALCQQLMPAPATA